MTGTEIIRKKPPGLPGGRGYPQKIQIEITGLKNLIAHSPMSFRLTSTTILNTAPPPIATKAVNRSGI